MRVSSKSWIGALCSVLCAFFLVSCSEPASYEAFLRSDQTGEDGRYHFSLDMTDSLSVYSLSFYTAIDGKQAQESVPVSINWKSDKGESFGELVYWTPSDEVVPYRKDIKPSEPCIWDLAVSVQNVPGMRGLGVIMQKNR